MNVVPDRAAKAPRLDELEAVAALLRRSGTRFESTVCGVSMAPAIPDGARIRIGPPRGGTFAPGQVVACVSGSTFFAHRVVYAGRDRRGALVITRGDGWMLCDPPTPHERILGEVSEWWDGGAWQAPGPAAPLRSWRRALATSSYWSVRLSLPIHREFARRMAGTWLGFGALFKSIKARA
jgi:hypothetical protein